jgi:hypothetical protein
MLRLQTNAAEQHVPLPCGRTGWLIADPRDERWECPITQKPLSEIDCPVQIGQARYVYELDGLLRWRAQESLDGRAHTQPAQNTTYALDEVHVVRYPGMSETRYNRNVKLLNAVRRAHGMVGYNRMKTRDDSVTQERHRSVYASTAPVTTEVERLRLTEALQGAAGSAERERLGRTQPLRDALTRLVVRDDDLGRMDGEAYLKEKLRVLHGHSMRAVAQLLLPTGDPFRTTRANTTTADDAAIIKAYLDSNTETRLRSSAAAEPAQWGSAGHRPMEAPPEAAAPPATQRARLAHHQQQQQPLAAASGATGVATIMMTGRARLSGTGGARTDDDGGAYAAHWLRVCLRNRRAATEVRLLHLLYHLRLPRRARRGVDATGGTATRAHAYTLAQAYADYDDICIETRNALLGGEGGPLPPTTTTTLWSVAFASAEHVHMAILEDMLDAHPTIMEGASDHHPAANTAALVALRAQHVHASDLARGVVDDSVLLRYLEERIVALRSTATRWSLTGVQADESLAHGRATRTGLEYSILEAMLDRQQQRGPGQGTTAHAVAAADRAIAHRVRMLREYGEQVAHRLLGLDGGSLWLPTFETSIQGSNGRALLAIVEERQSGVLNAATLEGRRVECLLAAPIGEDSPMLRLIESCDLHLQRQQQQLLQDLAPRAPVQAI